MRKYLPQFKSDFNKNVLQIFSGSVGSQAVTLLALPVLARLYTQEDFGYLQLFLSTVTSLSVVGSLRYELAIVLPKEEDDAARVTFISFLNLSVFTLLCGLFFLFGGKSIFTFFKAELLYVYFYYVVIGVFVMGLWQALQYVLIRNKMFGKLAKMRVVQALLIQLIALGLGFSGHKPSYLIIAQIAGISLVSFIALFYTNPRQLWKNRNGLWSLYKRYQKFAYINTPFVFLNTISMQLPVFMISAYFSEAAVGLYMMANKLAATPFRMLGKSVSQVYLKSASDVFHSDPEKLRRFLLNSVKKLVKAGILPLLGLLLFSPLLIDILLEESWQQSALFMQLLSVFLVAQFISSPVSQTFSIINRQEWLLVLTVFSLLIRYAAMYLFNTDVVQMLIAFSLTGAAYYIGFLFVLNALLKRLSANR